MSSNIAKFELSVGELSVTRQTLEAWGVLDCVVTQGEGGQDDTLKIVEATGDFNQSAFAAEQRVELWDETGTRRFAGDLVSHGEEYVQGNLRVTWTAEGPMRRMRKIPYKQDRSFYDDPTLESSGVSASETATVILNRVPPGGGTRTSLRAEIAEVFSQAGDANCYAETNEEEVPAQELPESRERVAKLADVLSVLSRSCPALSMGWDYESEVQLADVRARWHRYVPETPASQTGAMKVGETFIPKRRVDVSEMSGIDGIQREALHNLMVPVLKVQFIWRNTIDIDGRTLVRVGKTEQVSTIDNGAFGEEVITVELRGATFNNGEVTQEPEPVPAGNFADWLHPAYGRLWHRAQWTRHRDSCDFSVRIGELWEITGLGRTVEGVCIGVTHEIARGRTTVVIGPPQRLSIMSLTLTERLRGNSPEYGRAAEDEDGSTYSPDSVAEAIRDPLTCYDSGTAIEIVPGQLNGVAPATVAGSADWRYPRTAGKIYLKVVIVTATNVVTTREIHKAVSVPEPTQDSTTHTGYLELASITTTDDTVSVVPAYTGSRWAHIAWGPVSCAGGTLSQTSTLAWS